MLGVGRMLGWKELNGEVLILDSRDGGEGCSFVDSVGFFFIEFKVSF